MNPAIPKKKIVMLATACMMGMASYAQSVQGTVVDILGEPIIGASVQVKGTSTGVTTDMDGNFTLNGVKPGQQLVISYVGFITENVKVGNKNSYKVTMAEDSQSLDELVVVGYGTQRKADVTGATARVGSKELTAMPVSDALQGMQGKTAGVDIQNSQRPGEIGNIQVRGVRSLTADQGPLYVVDGMILQNGGIENINPQDIESIDVLKDAASTSVYGSRGANGVILVTTKRGSQGKMSVNYAGSVTFQWLSDVAKNMTASEWLDYARMAKYNSIDKNGNRSYNSTIGSDGKVIPVYDQDKGLWGSVAASWANIDKAWVNGQYDPSLVGGYDWAAQGKQTGVTHNHNISFSGGTEKFQGYGSFGYLNTEGTQPGQEYERFTMKANFDAQVLPYLKLGSSIMGAYGMQDYGYSFTKSVTGAGDYYGALQGMLPWTSPVDENGDFLRNPNGDVNIINPLNELQYSVNRRNTFNVNASFYGNVNFGKIYEPLAGLSYRIQFGPEFKFHEIGQYNNKKGINGDGNNKASWNKYQNRSWVLDNIITYNKTFAEKHTIGVTLLQSASKFHRDNHETSSSNVAMDTELWYNLGSSTSYKLGSDITEQSMSSYMARATYNYADKYLFTASVRHDGASQLAEGHKWATFPALSAAWRIDQEKFMEPTKEWLSSLKLRLGYGVSGNSAIKPYSTLGAAQGVYQQWGKDVVVGYLPSDASSASPSQAANNELTWERTGQFNLGVDFSFLNDRISGSIDYYHTKTTDLLLTKVIPSINGFGRMPANVGSSSGHGFDIQINAIPVKTKDFMWNLGLTWSADRSYIDELANGKTEDVANNWFVGEQIGVYYDYVYDGIWKTGQTVTLADGTQADAATYGRKTGQIKVADLNGDGKIDGNNDRAIVGKIRPDWTGGLSSSFKYKNWELSFFMFARMGFDIRAGALTLDGRYMQRSINYFVEGYNENADYYAPGINGESADAFQNAQNYQDGSYIKMRNINLGYTFTTKQLKKTGLSNLKVYAQLMNPFTIYSATDWLDTDLVNYANNSQNLGSTITTRSFVIGLNVGF